MNLKDILAISGQPGLYKFLAQGSHGVIVESLADGKRQNIPASARVSSLAEIAIFTQTEEKSLAKILQDMFRALEEREAVSHKASPDELTAFFEKMIPDYDRERVHVSDIKKVVSWYNILLSKGLIDLEEPNEETGEETPEIAGEIMNEKKTATVKPKTASAPRVSTASKAAAPKLTRGKKG